MGAIQVREIPDPLYKKLVETAQREGRSVAQQVTVLLAKVLGTDYQPILRRQQLLSQFREKPLEIPDLVNLPSPESLVREDRDL